MRQFALLLCLMTASLTAHANAPAHFVQRALSLDGVTYHYQVFVPDGWTAAKRWPVVLFLHGSGERGSDNRAQLSQGLPPWLTEHGKNFSAVVVIPQAPEGSRWSGVTEKMALKALDDSISAWHGDRRRLYLTGLSMGGYGSWQIAVDHPGMFAAAAIICGGIEHPNDAANLYLHGIPAGTIDPYAWVAAHIGALPVWIFHGALDDVVPPQESRKMAAAIKARNGDVRYTEFPKLNHGSWQAAYATEALWPWLLSHQLRPH